MSVQRKPKQHTPDITEAEKFISAAGVPAGKAGQGKSRKVPVALRFDHDLLNEIDKTAARRGMSRNSIISYWCSKALEGE